MPQISCPIEGCPYRTDEVDNSVAAALLMVHNNVHLDRSGNTGYKQKPPRLDRPRVTKDTSEEAWNVFTSRWDMFKGGTALAAGEVVQQLFQCCDDDLSEDILRCHKDALNGDEDGLLDVIKKLAVIPVATSVRRSELISMKQDHGENARSFFARINGKAATCAYAITCSAAACNQVVNYTSAITKDVLVTGLADDEIRKEVLGWADLDTKDAEATIVFIEAKEMARDALQKHSTAAVSTYKDMSRMGKGVSKVKATCNECGVEMEKFTWSRRQRKMIECALCSKCWKKANPPWGKTAKGKNPQDGARARKHEDESSALDIRSAHNDVEDLIIGTVQVMAPIDKLIQDVQSRRHGRSPLVLDHHIFHSQKGWMKAESMQHPTLRLRLTTEEEDYNQLPTECPRIQPSYVTVVTDTGAQSCLWSRKDFCRLGFQLSDLTPVKRTMVAANRETIAIDGAIFIRLSGTDASGRIHTAPVMVYVSPSTERFYLSREALVQLGVIPRNFPQVGAVMENCSSEAERDTCDCLPRILPPKRPNELPFSCAPENNEKMKEWLLQRYASSYDPMARPTAVQTPAMVPLHWQEQVEEQIQHDVAMGVLEEVPIGEPTLWCHRMVLTRKANGSPRRTVDLSPLNKHCLRETHHVKPPFQQAKAIPARTWKTVTDAWNGYHSVPICEEDRHLTTFITPWGRYRYKMAPQGFLASGDGYARRYDEVIADVQRKTKCVDDTVMWDAELAEHWWRIIDFLELVGRNGIVLSKDKFQFAQRSVDFAGFRITEETIQPAEKFLNAIQNFPTPTRITDIRSWFGLVHQVAHYEKLTKTMEPFRHLLSSKAKFRWTDELDEAFEESKMAIVNCIRKGVEIFDPSRRTCLRPDYSKKGIGYFLTQKHCTCIGNSPGCCEYGWRITLAGSRFLKPAESRYAPVEGEALAIAWALEQTKFFTLGCDNLLVVTDHKPLVRLLGDRTLDEISNSRLFSMKQRTLPWRFSIEWMPGKGNCFSDATSRNPICDTEINIAEILDAVRSDDDDDESNIETIVAANSGMDPKKIRAISWELVKAETSIDPEMLTLIPLIQSTFPEDMKEMPQSIEKYWRLRNQLYVVDGVVLVGDRVVIPSSLRSEVTQDNITGQGSRVVIPESLRTEVIQSLHSAHQGVSAMMDRARASVYWPGISTDIQKARSGCSNCNRIAPSHARPLPFEPCIPTTPFEAIACDYFHYVGHYYFIAADRLSGWTEQRRIKVGSQDAGAQGLCTALRKLFVTFGVPVELASDGGPEFVARETEDFLKRWGVRHRLSSVSHPSSNGRAELAVKATKRLLMDNVSTNGELDNDKMIRALLTQRNTPDPGCKLSPAQILFGRPLRDSLPYLEKDSMVFNNERVSGKWRSAWKMKEEALKTRYVKSLENLSEHARPLQPLQLGDHVMLQNQSGRFPKKWDRSGVVVETKLHDQYVVKVAGTGRLTLRNRRYLRKYTPVVTTDCRDFQPARMSQGFGYALPTLSLPPPSALEAEAGVAPPPPEVSGPDEFSGHLQERQTGIIVPPVTTQGVTPTTHSEPAIEPCRQEEGNLLRRSSRERRRKKVYDPSTGTYVDPDV